MVVSWEVSPMKQIKIILIVIIAVAAIGYGGYHVYGVGYSSGEQAGHDSGYLVGQAVGYQSGEQAGYQQGQSDGYGFGMQDGYQQGQAEGYTSGKEDGYDEGYLVGEQDGRDAGYAAGTLDGYDDGYDAGNASGYEQGVEDGIGHGYTISDPTYAGVLAFLAQDRTDNNEYVEGSYVCSHFTRDVCNNAEEAGIRCASVDLRYPDGGHTIIAFNTVDRGLVYFEPQTDEKVNPVIGQRYYQCVVPRPGYYYAEPDHDDTNQDILVIW